MEKVMSEFKSQSEVWQALLDGKTVCSMHYLWKIDNGYLVYRGNLNTVWEPSRTDFCGNISDLSIYTEPKKKKIVRMAPALVYTGETYEISMILFESEKAASAWYEDEFKKWLIDTHGIDVEVDDE